MTTGATRNDWTKNEARWVAEAGVSPESATRESPNGPLAVWLTCGRCSGKGRIWCFSHVDSGICFGCRGGKGRFMTVQKLAAAARAKERKTKRAERERHEAPRRAAKAAREFLSEHPTLRHALSHDDSDFTRSVARQLARKGELSEKQVAAVLRNAERKAAEPAAVEIEAGRRELTGTIVNVKLIETNFGLAEKMLVEIEPGARVFGTLPRAIDAVKRGDRIRFTATVEPKEKGFGFFSRPAKAELIEED